MALWRVPMRVFESNGEYFMVEADSPREAMELALAQDVLDTEHINNTYSRESVELTGQPIFVEDPQMAKTKPWQGYYKRISDVLVEASGDKALTPAHWKELLEEVASDAESRISAADDDLVTDGED